MQIKTWKILILALIALLPSCRVHYTKNLDTARVTIPEAYISDQKGVPYSSDWWTEFNDPGLDQAVYTALSYNLDLRQAWSRLSQAYANARIVCSSQIPQVDLNIRGTHREVDGVPGAPIGGTVGSTLSEYLVRGALNYEIDLWQRIRTECIAAKLEYLATNEDLENTALLLTGAVTEVWFAIQEQRALLDLFEEQIAVNQTNLELVELRFAIGEASALDVYQQRLQLTNTEEQPITASSTLQVAYNQLSILMGQPPSALFPLTPKPIELTLPPLPETGTPVNLFQTRPDLRAAYQRVLAADYQVASAVADLFPKLTLNLDYSFQVQHLEDVFRRKIWTIIGDLLYPVIDGSRRAAEVARRKAILCELLDSLYQQFLFALQEVEDALSDEKYQIELLDQIQVELRAAENTVREARWRYVNGLNDYLPVITAQQTHQNLQRREISETMRLFTIRSRLYRALGNNVWND